MAVKNVTLCPMCNSKLMIKRVECPQCQTAVEGHFMFDKFSYLSHEHKYFVEIFVKNRGNIKEVEKELGISYPTVRRMLDEVILELGYLVDKSIETVDKRSILTRLERGEITSDEALNLLRGKG